MSVRSPTVSPDSAERQRARRPTMREVAAVAGVSLSTVSRVVNGGAGVRKDLAERVRAAVDMLGYRHNLTASTLRRADRSSATIGVIFEDVSNPFFGSVHRGVEDIARDRGLLVATAVHNNAYLLRERAAGLALAFVDRPPNFFDADAVVSDNVGGAGVAVEHLIAAGHTRIAFLGDRPDVRIVIIIIIRLLLPVYLSKFRMIGKSLPEVLCLENISPGIQACCLHLTTRSLEDFG